ncbi:MAG: Grx4 family monothiol glutaredoxin [Halobacteriovoraceae bacterium]|nr:Grx4 family monothiol glutaredoxin [Halobacteriovoraceae bacterium]
MNNPFDVINTQNTGEAVSDLTTAANTKEKIEKLLNSSDAFLFMKGVPTAPQCGFSANTVAILSSLGVPFKSFDILEDPELRQAVKEHSSWPTYPQLYYKKQLVGGNDIITEMYQSGELAKLLCD